MGVRDIELVALWGPGMVRVVYWRPGRWHQWRVADEGHGAGGTRGTRVMGLVGMRDRGWWPIGKVWPGGRGQRWVARGVASPTW